MNGDRSWIIEYLPWLLGAIALLAVVILIYIYWIFRSARKRQKAKQEAAAPKEPLSPSALLDHF